jgi:hypothetical protein
MENTNTGDNNTGNGNSGNGNSGDFNSGNGNSGDFNSGDRNSGNGNSGDFNSGYFNSGDRNSGDRNSGDRNSGYGNSGYRNSGDRNSGYGNSGYGNSTNRESGIFCSTEGKVRIFNKPTNLTWDEIDHPHFSEFYLTKWISESEMTEEEKKDDPQFFVREGYLKTFTYKEAWANFWKDTDKENRQKFLNLPNFDADVFLEITGIDVRESDKKKDLLSKAQELIDKAEELKKQAERM